MKSLYYTAEIRFKPTVSKSNKLNTIKSLELATEHPWQQVSSYHYRSESFDIASHLKPSIVYLIIKETKKDIKDFSLSIYHISNFADKIVRLDNNKLTFIK